jgi:hypothetical protein
MSQPYIANARFDLAFIIAPAFVVTGIAIAAAPWAEALAELPIWLWILLILGVDVSHVYSTLYRTYFDKAELAARPRLYQLTPLVLWVAGAALYATGDMVFWRALAYLAIFHFVRQQFGFMMIYGRYEQGRKWLDKTAIYGATGLPLIYWLTHERSFNWFVEGDVATIGLPWIFSLAALAYSAILLLYLVNEIRRWRQTREVNVPKNLLLLGTGLSWGIGIVAFDNDIVFTATNVLAHGIPYVALIWLYGRNQKRVQGARTSHVSPWVAKVFSPWLIPLYLLPLALLAFVEEGLWDGLVFRDRGSVFSAFQTLPAVTDPHTLTWLVPLLALPQATHYVLDAFIWRKDGNVPDFSRFLFGAGARNE